MIWCGAADGLGRPGVDAQDGWDAEHEAALFLEEHRLEPTPDSHATALYALRHPDSALGREVARRTDGGVRLTIEDVEALRPLLRAHEEAGRGHGEWQRDLGVQAERLETLTSDARQITSDFTSDMAALSRAHHEAPDAMATKDMAGLLQQLIARITKTERDLAELSGNIASLRDRIETAPREDDVDQLTGVMSPSGARRLIAELPDNPRGYVLATCGWTIWTISRRAMAGRSRTMSCAPSSSRCARPVRASISSAGRTICSSSCCAVGPSRNWRG
ncbi:hypothetical protein SPKIRA_18830 [Sphingomonas paucimobilis]|nr:hypothetical protein SPKIRA_18830 [Sphingomonas paucimobilis]